MGCCLGKNYLDCKNPTPANHEISFHNSRSNLMAPSIPRPKRKRNENPNIVASESNNSVESGKTKQSEKYEEANNKETEAPSIPRPKRKRNENPNIVASESNNSVESGKTKQSEKYEEANNKETEEFNGGSCISNEIVNSNSPSNDTSKDPVATINDEDDQIRNKAFSSEESCTNAFDTQLKTVEKTKVDKDDPNQLLFELNSLKENASKYEDEIELFKSSFNNRNYRYIEESLIRIQIKLDRINIDVSQEVRSKRKEIIMYINGLFERLDKYSKNFSDGN